MGYPIEINGYRLSIVETTVDGEEAFLVKAEPINTHGFFFHAYHTYGAADDVIQNIVNTPFDDQVYRVNFKPDNGKFFPKSK